MSFGFAARGRFDPLRLLPAGSGSGSPTGPAGGDLNGFYPSPAVASVGGVTAAQIADAVNSGQVFHVRWTGAAGVNPAGFLYLQPGPNVVATTAGEVFPTDVKLLRLSVVVDSADGANDYLVEVGTDPTGTFTPLVGASLLLAATNRIAFSGSSIDAALMAGTEYGVRVSLSAGMGQSAFKDIVVDLEFSRLPPP